ncbi:ROK family transcriptional regulator [Nonomuraea harbinensis]|uniref:ROK family transcriptional regulator n=1 Tax=Nonomuraea harbinensis TaxID=1286938 RepID=A0ABW1C740_9ACTN|nr:ROK family transcriptional regulator [Nonomuraea harbinensis]
MKRTTPRQENAQRERLLRLLQDGPRNRAELGDLVRLSRSALAGELARLSELALIEEVELATSRKGRRSRMVRLSPSLRFAAVVIGAASVNVAITTGDLEILAQASESCDARQGPDAALSVALDLLGELRSQGLAPRLHGVGMGVPGPVSFRDDFAVVPPVMPGWDRYPVRDALTRRLGCPALIDNDANLMALGEMHAGVARTAGDFLLVKLGTGIGCGIVIDGGIHRGASGSAGDIGHVQLDDHGPACLCGNTGCLEAYIGGTAIARQAEEAARSGTSAGLAERLARAGRLTAQDAGAAAAAGDATAIAMIRDGGRRLGQVLADLVSFFNPGLIVIAGGLADLTGLGHVVLTEVRSVVHRRSPPLATRELPIMLSELGDTSGVVGAAKLISTHVLSHRPADL